MNLRLSVPLALLVIAAEVMASADAPSRSSGPVLRAGAAAMSGAVIVTDCRVLLMDQVTLAADRNGILWSAMPREGDFVAAGQRIVRLKDDVPASALAVARKQAENDVEIRYAVKAAEVAQTEYERALEANRQLTGTLPDIEIRRLKLSAERAVLQIEQAQSAFDVKMLQRDQAVAELQSFQIEAPFDGMITRVIRSRGEAVHQGDPVIEVASTRRVKVEGEVALNQSLQLQPGQPVQVQMELDGLPAEIAKTSFAGKLVFVDVTVQPVSGRVRIWAEVENKSNLLRAGVPARMTIAPMARAVAGSVQK